MLTDNWVIHIGYPRAGSTWLQNNLFPHISNVEFLGTNSLIKQGWAHQLKALFADSNLLDFSPSKIRDFIERNTQDRDANKIWIWSSEAITGFYNKRGFQYAKINADHLKQTFGNAKILIVIRNQLDHLKSLYRHYLLWGGITSLEFLLDSPRGARNAVFCSEDFMYNKLIRYYIELFGPSNVCTIPFELLREDVDQYVADICKFIGVNPPIMDDAKRTPVYAGYTTNFCRYVRILNHFTRTPFNPDGWLHRSSRIPNPYAIAKVVADFEERIGIHRYLITQEREEALKDLYRPANEELQKSVAYDLAKYGYPM